MIEFRLSANSDIKKRMVFKVVLFLGLKVERVQVKFRQTKSQREFCLNHSLINLKEHLSF